MSIFSIKGTAKLKGSIAVSGNKNEALPAIAAALLCRGRVRLENVPDIGDVRTMLDIARTLGARISPLKNGTVTLCAPAVKSTELPLDLCGAIRGSLLFASTLLVRCNEAVVPQPGGDTIGRRRTDTHYHGFQALGATLSLRRRQGGKGSFESHFHLKAPSKGLTGAEIFLDEASVTATENALIAAAGARGKTVITNAASEPHVQGLCRMLCAMGAHIEGIGSNVLTVSGADTFKPVTHVLGSDYIEAGSLVGLAAATGSAVSITNVDTQFMRMILYQFERLGIVTRVDHARRTIHVPEKQPLKIRRDLGGVIPKFEDSPWPGFPADLTSIALVTATQSQGICLVHEKMFESRLFFVDRLISMGAQIVLCDPHRAVVAGPSPLYASTMSSPDIRAGMALLIAALAAEGRSIIQNVEQIDRGYRNIDKRLNALGACITRQS